MAFTPGYTATFSFNGVDISAFTKTVKFNRVRKELKLPRIGGNQVAKLVGPVDNMITLNGFQDEVVQTLFTAEQDIPTAPTPKAFEYGPSGATGPLRTGLAYLITYDEDSDADQANTWTATLAVDGAVA